MHLPRYWRKKIYFQNEVLTMLARILFAEDEPDIQQITQIALDTVGGYSVKACASGQEAIDAVVEFAPDLIILDVMMPGLDGLDTLKKLREIPEVRNTPIVFMTAKAQPKEVMHFKSLGAKGVITKPFDPMKLADEVRRIWEE